MYGSLRPPFDCTPACQFRSTADRCRPLNARCTFCFRLTARSLRIQKAVIFTPPLLYLEVNGCQETNEAAHNSCASSRRLLRDGEGGVKHAGRERHSFALTSARTHTNLLSLSSGLGWAISQSRFSLAYYISTYSLRFRMMENVAAHYLALQLLQGSNS